MCQNENRKIIVILIIAVLCVIASVILMNQQAVPVAAQGHKEDVYEKYGLIYNEDGFFYDGQKVRCFFDPYDNGYDRFKGYYYFNEGGLVDLYTVKSGKDLKIQACSQEEFDARTLNTTKVEGEAEQEPPVIYEKELLPDFLSTWVAANENKEPYFHVIEKEGQIYVYCESKGVLGYMYDSGKDESMMDFFFESQSEGNGSALYSIPCSAYTKIVYERL